METIFLDYPLDKSLIYPGEIVIALGFFDGVHLGHQRVIKTALEKAYEKNLLLAVMTFNQTPRIIHQNLDPDEVTYLTTVERKCELFDELGVDITYVVNYTQSFADQSPQDFVDNYLVGLNVNTAVAGFDYTYGQKGVANMARLPEYSQGRFEIVEVPELKVNSEKVASRRLRQLVLEGDIQEANQELGYRFQTSGVVSDGQKRGRKLGFPTANLDIDPKQMLPRTGVYATRTKVGDKWYLSMTQIGFNLTFNGEGKTVESYILDFNQDIYGQKVTIEWNKYLRDEIKFDSVDQLIDQLKSDEESVRDYFNKN